MLSAAPRLQRLCVGVRRPYLVAFTITLAALVSAIAASSIYAQTPDEHPTDKWVREGGTVQTNKATLTIREGETASYSVRLSKRPHNEDEKNDGWWVRILVDSANRVDGEHDVDGDGQDDLSWRPSVGWEFDLDDWVSDGPGPWRNILISALEDDDTNDQTITFAHELWDHNNYCPPKLHGSGSPLAVVTVHIIDNDDGNNENGNGNGGDNGNGNGNGGDNGNGDENGNLNGNGDGNGNENGTGNGEGNGDGDGNGNGNGGGNNGGGNDPSLPTLSIADATAAEGEPARFSVTLRPASEQTVTVSYRTAGGTAAAGLDFDTVSGTLTFAPRTTRQVIAVQTREDEIDEPDEAFTVTLSNPSGAVLAAATASGTITDDDMTTLSIADATAVEGEPARFSVTLRPASEQTVTVSYRTAGGTAAAGLDFDTVSGTLTFAPRTTRQVIAVQTREDEIDEPDEAFTVTLSDPSGAVLAAATASGTITDDDVPTLSIADATAVEGEPARFSVTLRPASEQTVTVSYRTAGGTAAAGLDFDTVSGTLTFAPRTTRQVIAVQTREDEIDEPDEAFTVTLSNPSGAMLADATASGTITDDDVRSLEPINQALLPELSRALAFTAVRCRIEQAFSDMSRGWAKPSFQPSLSLVPPSLEWEGADARPPTLEQVLSSTSFLVPLMGEEGGAASFATWGCGDYRKLAGDGKGGIGPWDAETFSMQVGADAIVDTNVLAGVALSQSRGTLNFDEASGSGEAGVRYDLRLTGVHPYLGLWVSPDLEIWGALSLGRVTLRIADALAGASLTSAATLASGTVGLNGQLLKRGAMTLRLKGEGAIAHMDFARSSTAFRKMAIDLQRLRLAVEADYEQVIPYVGVLAPWGELGLRHDGGDGESGASLEIGGGLHLRNIEQGWNAEVYGRWLAVREGERPEEQGIGARFRYDPDAPGFGPWVSLTQSWGETASGLPRLWKDDAINLKSHNPSAGRLDAELAYGISAFSGQGTITPYGAMSLKSTDGRSYRLGGRLMLGSWATVSVDAERREHLAEAPAYTVTIGGTVRF